MRRRTFARLRGDRGQVLPLIVLFAFVLLGFAGLAIDFARVWVVRQQLERAVDAAALAAGQKLPDTTTGYAQAVTYDGQGSGNTVGGWGVTASAPTVTYECVSHAPDYTSGSTPTCLTDTSGASCHPQGSATPTPAGVTTCNAVKVTETATVNTSFLSLFRKSFTVSASSTAAARGGVPNPLNVVVIVDTSGSMGPPGAPSGDPYCTASVAGINSPAQPDKLDCAKAGVRAMLQSLEPCSTDVSPCPNIADEVGLVVFPAITGTLTTVTNPVCSGNPQHCTTGTYGLQSSVDSAYEADETSCPSSAPTASRDTYQDTYPPYEPYTYNSGATAGGIPTLNFYDTDSGALYDSPNNTNWQGDNFPGYEAVPLSDDYRTSNTTSTLNPSSSVVNAVYWSQCQGSGAAGGGVYPGGDWYGLKDITEYANIHEGSYLAGAITEAQYMLTQAPYRVGVAGQAVTNAIVILSDGGMDQPQSSIDGVDPASNGNQGWTDNTPCADADNAATQAKAAGTVIYSIAYDSSGNCNDPTGSGGLTDTTAADLMQDMATDRNSDYFDQTGAGDLTAVFSAIGTSLSGDSRLVPDCTQAPPAC
jgi:Flp pilus assembly protein TadG